MRADRGPRRHHDFVGERSTPSRSPPAPPTPSGTPLAAEDLEAPLERAFRRREELQVGRGTRRIVKISPRQLPNCGVSFFQALCALRSGRRRKHRSAAALFARLPNSPGSIMCVHNLARGNCCAGAQGLCAVRYSYCGYPRALVSSPSHRWPRRSSLSSISPPIVDNIFHGSRTASCSRRPVAGYAARQGIGAAVGCRARGGHQQDARRGRSISSTLCARS